MRAFLTALFIGWMLIFVGIATAAIMVHWSFEYAHPETWTRFGRALWFSLSLAWLWLGLCEVGVFRHCDEEED